MNLIQPHGPSFQEGEESLKKVSLDTQNTHMQETDDVSPVRSQQPLSAHDDARSLIRLIQCSQCSRPFRLPVTLPCGHSICRDCLPPSHTRLHISYPNTPGRQVGIHCPIRGCRVEHSLSDCALDVTLLKVMESIAATMAAGSSQEEMPILVEEIPKVEDSRLGTDEKSTERQSWALQGGRLSATFTLAERGDLHIDSDLVYQSLAIDGNSYQHDDVTILNQLRESASKELDCNVCYNMMLDPVTTPCGHSFCRKCLARVLDHSQPCPFCRRLLPISQSLARQASNSTLGSFLNGLCPELVAQRAEAVAFEENTSTDSSMPLFVCTLALPAMPTYLHVFEPRYRLMMRRALDSNRQFGMVMYNRFRTPQGDLGPHSSFTEYGTILEIINFQMLPDGRSFIETKGVGRFKVKSHGITDGYITGAIERVQDVSLIQEEQAEVAETMAAAEMVLTGHEATDFKITLERSSTRDLLFRGLQFVERMRTQNAEWLNEKIVEAYGGPPEDPAIFPYWFAAVLPIHEAQKYELLATVSVRQRLKIINQWIHRIETSHSAIVLSRYIGWLFPLLIGLALAFWTFRTQGRFRANSGRTNLDDQLADATPAMTIQLHLFPFPTPVTLKIGISFSLCLVLTIIFIIPCTMMRLGRPRYGQLPEWVTMLRRQRP